MSQNILMRCHCSNRANQQPIVTINKLMGKTTELADEPDSEIKKHKSITVYSDANQHSQQRVNEGRRKKRSYFRRKSTKFEL